MSRLEHHKSHRTGWLRAAVLGANDGIVSTASLIIGVASANASHENVMLAGVAGLVAGAMSMAAGEYVSVSSQADTEKADLALEQKSIEEDYDFELDELAAIYEERGVEPELARQVSVQMMEHDALGAHARDEIGISEILKAHPIQAGLASAAAFTFGALLPLLVAWLGPLSQLSWAVAVSSLAFLAILGGLAAGAGGAPKIIGAVRVCFWGALAMALTATVGWLFDVAV
jgi:VIT1/CCC1 family predicted Fe2+/Mn2+ transporter